MKTVAVLVALTTLILGPTACSSPIDAGLDAMCATGVLINGTWYNASSTSAVIPEGMIAGAVLGTVAVHDPVCNDMIELDENGNSDSSTSVRNWESNVFPVGTPIYSIQGVPATDRLLAKTASGWTVLFNSAVNHDED